MSMADIVSAIHADPVLTGYVSPLGAVVTPVTGTLGASHKYDMSVMPPLVTWVPAADSFGGSNQGGLVPKSVGTRWVGFSVEVHGQLSPAGNIEDFATTEELLNRFLYAVHRATSGNCHLHSGSFLGQDGEETYDDRKVYRLGLAIGVPIVEPAGITGIATIASETLAGEMDFLDGQMIGPLTPPP